MKLVPALNLSLAALATVLTASAQDGLPVADLQRDTPVDFSKEIVPFLKKNCFACHNEKKAKADLNLESPKAMLAGGDSGPALVPGEPMESLVFTYSAHLEDDVMPPAKNKSNAVNLTPDELALLKLWIEQGGEGTAASVLAGPTEWQPLDGVHALYSVAISDDGRFAACGRGNRLYIYDLRTGRLEAELTDEEGSPGSAHRDFVHALAFNRHGVLASGGYRTVKLWNREINPGSILPHKLAEGATALATNGNGEWLVAGDSKGNVVLRNLGQPEDAPAINLHPAAVEALALSSDGKFLYSSSTDKSVTRALLPEGKTVSSISLPSEAHSLALLDRGKLLAAGCADGVIRIFPAAAFDQAEQGSGQSPSPVELKGHTGKVHALAALNEEGSQVLSASEDGTARIWDLAGKQLRQVAHGAPISALAAHPASGVFATAGNAGLIQLWNAADGKKLHELKGDLDFEQRKTRATQQRDLAKRLAEQRKKEVTDREKQWTDLNGKARTDAGKVAEALKDLAAKERNARSKRQLATQADAQAAALEAAKDPGLGKAREHAKKSGEEATKAENELVTAERNLRNAERTRDLAVKDGTKAGERFLSAQAASAQADSVLATAEEVVKALEAEGANIGAGAVKALAFSPDGETLAVGAEKTGLRLWSATTGKPLDTLPTNGSASAIVYARGQLVAALPENRIAAWNNTVAWKLSSQIGDPSNAELFSDRVLALAFHPRGHLLATGSGIPSRDGELRFWRVQDAQLEGVIEKAHLDTITGLAFSPDGNRIVSASTDRYLKIHSVETRELLDQLEGHTNHILDVAWSADGGTLASAGADHVAKLWDVASSKQKKTESGFKKELTAIAFVGDGENIVMGGGDKILKAAGQNLSGVDDFVYDTAVSPDGAVIIGGGEKGILRVWQSSDRKLLHSFAPPPSPPSETASK